MPCTWHCAAADAPVKRLYLRVSGPSGLASNAPCTALPCLPCLPTDIRESITQLQYYRKNIFIKWSGPNLP
jgi:hypothetical protein